MRRAHARAFAIQLGEPVANLFAFLAPTSVGDRGGQGALMGEVVVHDPLMPELIHGVGVKAQASHQRSVRSQARKR